VRALARTVVESSLRRSVATGKVILGFAAKVGNESCCEKKLCAGGEPEGRALQPSERASGDSDNRILRAQ
jgi:hypothetical protein